MERVIVSVECVGHPSVDLELPAEVPVRRLTTLITAALGWQEGRAYQATVILPGAQNGRALSPDSTLADVGAWDGSQLLLQPAGALSGGTPRVTSAPAAPVMPPVLVTGPVTGFRSLGLSLQEGETREEPPDSGEEQPRSGFVWKQLD